MTSPARLEANRRNAQKSTGSRSPEGKARSARNALKYGLTARSATPVEGEDPAAIDRHPGRWKTDLKPGNVAEEALIEPAGLSPWTLKRSAKSEAAAVATNVRHAAEDYDLAQKKRAYDLGWTLLYDPVVRTNQPNRTAEFTAAAVLQAGRRAGR